MVRIISFLFWAFDAFLFILENMFEKIENIFEKIKKVVIKIKKTLLS